MYHSPRIRRASTAINHYYPDRTHSRRVPHSSPSCLASRRSFIHARPVTVVPRESARGCLPTPLAIITSLYIIISQWTILFVNNLLAFTIRGNNLKLRNHSRELITGPHACPLARCTSRRPRHVHVVHWAYFRLRRRRPRPRKKRSRSPPAFSLRSLDRTTYAESINALASTFSPGFPRQPRRRRRGTGASSPVPSSIADCCGRIAASSSPLTGPIADLDLRLGDVIDHPRACFPIPSFLVRHTGGTLLST